MEVKKIPKKTVTLIEPKRSVLVDKEKYHQKRVAAYCRVSTDSEEQLTSYVNQKKFYTDMIARNTEWEFAGLYADEGISGTRADKRPEFNNMIKACLAGKIDYIITKSVSRFARNTVDCLDYVRLLRARGIGIFFEEQNIDTLKSDSELYLVIYAGFAQSESESISKNITWSYRKNFEDGKPIFMFKKLLGYKKGEDGEPVIVPEEAEIVERIYTMYLSGMTVDVISRQLQSEHIVIPDKKFTFVRSNFRYLKNWMRYYGVDHIDGLLADLGVSSHHFDDAERGFSFRFDAPLDMRMNKRAGQTAADILNNYDEARLADIFYIYGEMKNSRRIAAAVAKARQTAPINTTSDFLAVVEPMFKREREKKDMARLFQALRIEVNHEMDALREMLAAATQLLAPGGRLSVITYHSLEDRIVKNVMKAGNPEGKVEQDFFGRINTPYRMVEKLIIPSEEEQQSNPRSRSAKLRVAERKGE